MGCYQPKSAISTLNFVFRIACFGDLQSFWIKVSLLEWNRIERPNVNFYFIKIEPNLIKYRLVGAGKDKSGPDNRNLRKKAEKAFGQLRQSLNPKVNLCKNFKMQSQFSTRNENIPNIPIPKNHKSYLKILKIRFFPLNRFASRLFFSQKVLWKNFKFSPYEWIDLSKTRFRGWSAWLKKRLHFSIEVKWSGTAKGWRPKHKQVLSRVPHLLLR